jgi:hypothetical protein
MRIKESLRTFNELTTAFSANPSRHRISPFVAMIYRVSTLSLFPSSVRAKEATSSKKETTPKKSDPQTGDPYFKQYSCRWSAMNWNRAESEERDWMSK